MIRITFLPETRFGKWSVGLMVAFYVLLLMIRILATSGQQGGETFFDNPILAIPALLMGISGVFAFFTGIVAILKNKERFFLVYITTTIGLLVLIFWLGEILSPH